MADATAPKTETKPEAPKPTNGRIPLKKVWLNKAIDMPGHSQLWMLDCAPQTKPGRRFFVAHFVPAHQIIEVESYLNEHSEPYRTRIAMSLVERFD